MLSWFSECGCFSSNLPAIYLGIQSKTVLSHWFSKSKSKRPESRYGSLMTWKFWKDYLQTKTTAPSFSKNKYVEWEIKLKAINEGCPVTILFYFLFGDMRLFFFFLNFLYFACASFNKTTFNYNILSHFRYLTYTYAFLLSSTSKNTQKFQYILGTKGSLAIVWEHI